MDQGSQKDKELDLVQNKNDKESLQSQKLSPKLDEHQKPETQKKPEDNIANNQIGKNAIDLNKQQIESDNYRTQNKTLNNESPQQVKQTGKNQPSKNQPSKQKLIIKSELQSMQFQQGHILQALEKTSSLEQAIEFIISKIQSLDQQQYHDQTLNQVKIFFVVRMDLKMGVGKIAAQVAHASLKAFQQMRYAASNNDKSANLLIQWMEKGKPSRILQAQTQYELRDFLQQASNRYINNCSIRDAGRTQIAAGSMTVVAIGPINSNQVRFLKKLKQI